MVHDGEFYTFVVFCNKSVQIGSLLDWNLMQFRKFEDTDNNGVLVC